MIALDAADLVVIAGRILGTGPDAALAQLDIAAAEAALAEACLSGEDADREAVAGAGIALVHALLRHHPFPDHGQRVAVAAGLQFISLNGWRADLNPPAAAAVVVEALAAGQLSPDAAAAWLSPRLSSTTRPRSRPRPRPRSRRSPRRVLVSVLLTITLSGLALLATACSHSPAAKPAPAVTVVPTANR